ncbi:hypothetical protein DM77_3106 [Burkholderia mallei]|nr:hypothetical protein DM77_3106 [Burkholderia mallei]
MLERDAIGRHEPRHVDVVARQILDIGRARFPQRIGGKRIGIGDAAMDHANPMAVRLDFDAMACGVGHRVPLRPPRETPAGNRHGRGETPLVIALSAKPPQIARRHRRGGITAPSTRTPPSCRPSPAP